MKLKFYEITKTKFSSKLNSLFSSSSSSAIDTWTSNKTKTPPPTTITQKQTNLTIKKKGKEYNGGVDVDEESPMLEEVVAPSK